MPQNRPKNTKKHICQPTYPIPPLLLPSARMLFYPYACGAITVGFLVAASGNNSYVSSVIHTPLLLPSVRTFFTYFGASLLHKT